MSIIWYPRESHGRSEKHCLLRCLQLYWYTLYWKTVKCWLGFFFFCAWIKGIANNFGGKYPFLKSKQNPACFFSVPSKATPPKYIHMLSRLSPWMLVQELTCNMTDRQVEMPPYPDWLDVRDPCHFSWEVLATRIFPLCIYLLQQILQQWANQKIGFNDQTKQNSFGVYV